MRDHNSELDRPHLADEELVRFAHHELSSARAAEVQAHLDSCRGCCTRAEELQSAMAALTGAHHDQFDKRLPSVTGPRALLRARLSELSSETRLPWWRQVLRFEFNFPRASSYTMTLTAVAALAIATGILWLRNDSRQAIRRDALTMGEEAAPKHALTPGVTRQVTMREVCSIARERVVADVPNTLRQQVLREYGITNARPEDYEIDYLIAPGLGGSEDIGNLWPEPYHAPIWNARVKDALEERLHEMVCSGQLDLSTAQHDIASDWIGAYKKYFQTNTPLPLTS